MKNMIRFSLVALLLCTLSSSVFAQKKFLSPDLFGLGGNDATTKSPVVTMLLTPQDAKPGDVVTLSIRITLPPKGYTYSMTKGLGGFATTVQEIKLIGLEPIDKSFTADHKPISHKEPLFDDKFVEKYKGDVTWKRKYRLLPKADVTKVSLTGMLSFQYCDAKQCTIQEKPINLTLQNDGSLPVPVPAKQKPVVTIETHPYDYQVTPTHGKKKTPEPLSLQFALLPENAKPGETVTLAVTMELKEGWHTYAQTQNPENTGLPIVFNLKNINGLLQTDGHFRPSHPPETKFTKYGNKEQKLFHGKVTWRQNFKVSAQTQAGKYGIRGQLKYQVCNKTCLPPRPFKFALGSVKPASFTVAKTKFIKPDKPPVEQKVGTKSVEKTEQSWLTSTFYSLLTKLNELEKYLTGLGTGGYLIAAFLGGLILNCMPCVLPVLSIKFLSFAKQAGEQKSKLLTLNLAYAAGVISVFLVLAVLAISLDMDWGGLNQKPVYIIIMTCFIFALSLSLLGIFEIPIPGLVGSAASSEQKEGPLGAFFTGIYATLLATPCTGPLMGAVLAWSLDQSTVMTLSVWAVMGVGMASPYLLLAIFPQAIRLMPKPGMWMVRFKEFSGFCLLGTVIYFISIQKENTIAILVILLGIAIGLWMIGSMYNQTSSNLKKMMVRFSALALTSLICFGGAMLMGSSEEPLEANNNINAIDNRVYIPGSTELPWEAFSEEKLTHFQKSKHVILIDFTASWCINCQLNEATSLNTVTTNKFVHKNAVVTLKADYSKQSPVIKSWLKKFGRRGIPLTVIIPADKKAEPILLDSIFSESVLLEKLKIATGLPQEETQKLTATTHSTRE